MREGPAILAYIRSRPKLPLKVTGVVKDVPENSHIKFTLLVSFNALPQNRMTDFWTWPEFYTYILLRPGTDPRRVETRFPALIDEHLGKIMSNRSGRNDAETQLI